MFISAKRLRLASIFALLIFDASGHLARAKSPAPQSAFGGHVAWGACRYKGSENPDLLVPIEGPPGSDFPVLCVKPKVAAQGFFREDVSTENTALNLAKIYWAAHGRYFSLHGKHEKQRLFRLGATDENAKAIDDQRTRFLFLQLGNVGLDRFRASVGKLPLPFGINYHPLPEIYDQYIRSPRYWRGPRYGVRLTYDTQVSSMFDLGYFSEHVGYSDHEIEPDEEHSRINSALVIRGMFDIAALDGFRFVVSAYADRMHERRFSTGFVNTSRRGDQTTFEWVRVLSEPRMAADYRQNFRFNYLSPFRETIRWNIDFESERGHYRMGTVGLNFMISEYALYKLDFSYNRGWNSDQGQFLAVASGLEVAL